MTELELLLKDIDNLRNNLYKLLISKKNNVYDSEVLTASKKLNAAINKYNEVISKKI